MIIHILKAYAPFVKEGRAVEKLLQLALELGFDHAALLDASRLRALNEVREMCVSGRCRRYGGSWSCPPACGTPPAARLRNARPA